jgi:hypothetical protein
MARNVTTKSAMLYVWELPTAVHTFDHCPSLQLGFGYPAYARRSGVVHVLCSILNQNELSSASIEDETHPSLNASHAEESRTLSEQILASSSEQFMGTHQHSLSYPGFRHLAIRLSQHQLSGCTFTTQSRSSKSQKDEELTWHLHSLPYTANHKAPWK